MSGIGIYDPNYAEQIKFNLSQVGKDGEVAANIANKVNNLEADLTTAYSNLGKATTAEVRNSIQADISELEIQYKRATRTYEAFMQLMKNAHELLMRGIQNLSLR